MFVTIAAGAQLQILEGLVLDGGGRRWSLSGCRGRPGISKEKSAPRRVVRGALIKWLLLFPLTLQ